MRRRIVLIANTYPDRGEAFLETELELLDGALRVDVWPLFAEGAGDGAAVPPGNVTIHRFHRPRSFSLPCFLRALWDVIRLEEPGALTSGKGFFYKFAKAVKFAYLSETRIRALGAWLRREAQDGQDLLLYAYWMYEAAFVAARLKGLFPRCAFVTRCHGYDLYETRHAHGYLPFRRFILEGADRIYPVSNHALVYLHRRYGGIYDQKTALMRLGTLRRSPLADPPEQEDALVLASCSNMVPVKRIHRIIQALGESHRRIHWYHAGDGALRTELEAQAKALPPTVRWSFLGYLANEDLQRFYGSRRIDAFVNVSASEGVPVSIMEAQSYGIPVIATDVGGTAEIVHDGENGVLLSSDFTDEELLAAIDRAAAHRQAYGAAAMRTWQTMSDERVLAPAFYQQLAEV